MDHYQHATSTTSAIKDSISSRAEEAGYLGFHFTTWFMIIRVKSKRLRLSPATSIFCICQCLDRITLSPYACSGLLCPEVIELATEAMGRLLENNLNLLSGNENDYPAELLLATNVSKGQSMGQVGD